MKSVQPGISHKPRVSLRSTPYLYMKVHLSLEDASKEWTPTLFKFIVIDAVKETLGQVGASSPVDILKTWPHGKAILRVPSKMSESIWAALTLYRKTPSGILCALRVEKATPFLAALAFDIKNES